MRILPEDNTAKVALIVAAAYFLVARWYPIVDTFLLSLKKATFFSETWVGLANYQKLLFRDVDSLQTFSNTLKFALMVTPVTVVVGLALAWMVHRIRKPGVRSMFNAAFFLPFVVPVVAVSIVWKYMFQPSEIGLFNRILGLAGLEPLRWLSDPKTALPSLAILSVWKRAGYAMIIYLTGLLSIPESYYEAALIDGAGSWNRFRRITLPLLAPTTLFVLVVTTISSLMVFETPFVMTTEDSPGSVPGGPANSTNVVVLNIFMQGFRFNRIGYASASAVALFLLIVAISVVQFRLASRRYES